MVKFVDGEFEVEVNAGNEKDNTLKMSVDVFK